MSAVHDSLLYTFDPTNTSSLNYDDPILFNYDYVADKTGVIIRNPATGEFIITKPGNYLVNWWVVIQTSTSSNGVGFGIKGKPVSATTFDTLRAATNSISTGEFAGNSIISLTEAQLPYAIQLVNITGYTTGDASTIVVLGLYSTAQAGITISELDNSGGIIGPVGPVGPQGPLGITGATGPQGLQGLSGNDGAQGPVGSTGSAGLQGIPGVAGARGPQGIAGPRGSIGPQGPIGQRGLQGPVGPQGPQGDQGSDGAQGDQGPMGPQGPDGATGPQGAQGNQGSDGIQGDQGPMGPQGPIGQQGDTGNAGKNGAPNKISGINYSMAGGSKIIIDYEKPLVFTQSDVDFVMDSTGFSGTSSINVNPNGDFDLLEPGLYDFEWYVCIAGIDQVIEISFDVIPVVNGVPDYTTSLIHCAYPVVIIGQVNAQGLIPITTPTTVRIINSSTPSGQGTGVMSLVDKLDVAGAIKVVAYTNGVK